MKNTIKGLIRLSSFALLFLLLPTLKVEAQEIMNETVIEKTEIKKVDDLRLEKLANNNPTAENFDDLLQKVYKAAVARDKTLEINYRGDWKDLPSGDDFYEQIIEIDDKKTSDDADYLYGGMFSFGYNVYTDGDESVLRFRFSHLENASQLKKVNAEVKKILKKLNVSKLSDVAKVKALHDYVIKLVSYDRTLKDHSAYGGLIAKKHTTVCQGYTLIMYKLLTEAGMEARYINGYVGDVGHAWNIVKIGNKWYSLDATWDDYGNSAGYTYFLCGDKTLLSTRELRPRFINKYNTPAKDYNWKSAIKKSKSQWDKEVAAEQKKAEKEKAKMAKQRADFAVKVEKSFDSSGAKTSPELEELYDLRNKIYGYIIKDISAKAFKKLKKGDKSIKNAFYNGTQVMIDDYIYTPVLDYLYSEEYAKEAERQVKADFPDLDFDTMSEDELKEILRPYLYEAFCEKLAAYSEKKTNYIVKFMVNRLNKMV